MFSRTRLEQVGSSQHTPTLIIGSEETNIVTPEPFPRIVDVFIPFFHLFGGENPSREKLLQVYPCMIIH